MYLINVVEAVVDCYVLGSFAIIIARSKEQLSSWLHSRLFLHVILWGSPWVSLLYVHCGHKDQIRMWTSGSSVTEVWCLVVCYDMWNWHALRFKCEVFKHLEATQFWGPKPIRSIFYGYIWCIRMIGISQMFQKSLSMFIFGLVVENVVLLADLIFDVEHLSCGKWLVVSQITSTEV